MKLKTIKNLLKPLINLPIHPQWHTSNLSLVKTLLNQASPQQNWLDLGCATMWPRDHLPIGSQYVGLDYYQTATDWYETKPNIYADAQQLPFDNGSFDNVLALDVLEHLPSAEVSLKEIARVLKPGGEAIIRIPFMYPLHDLPLDYRRLSPEGMRAMAELANLELTQSHAQGNSIETAALLLNIASCQLSIDWINHRSPLALLSLLLPGLVFTSNITSFLLARFSKAETIMPFSYTFVLKKPAHQL